MGTYLIDNVRVLDGTGRPPFAGQALVDGNRITRVTAAAPGPRPANATHIDGRGATLMPGLVG